MVQITAVKLVGDEKHESITEVQWINPVDKKTGTSTKQVMVEFVKGGGQAVVTDGVQTIKVGVFDTTPPYIRTIADGVWTDNLLSLPRY